LATNADPVASSEQSSDEIRQFLGAISNVLRETVSAFETTVTRITEITVTGPRRADRDLVVALQDFDRLQQEFAILGEVLAKLSIKADKSQDNESDEVISAIALADLKNRLSQHLRILKSDMPQSAAEDVEF
jgi:hypothetical protein